MERLGSLVMGRFQRVLLAAASAAALAAGQASAQTAQPDGRTVYEAAWFARFAPSTAWDMASQVPGFTVENGETVRGFAGAAGNVVINGARPSAKAESLESILRRIPAAQVVRLEIVPGQVVGGEYRARAQVLNVVLAGELDGLSGSYDASLGYVYTGRITPSGGVSVLRRKGATSLSLAARYDAERTPDEGFDTYLALPSRTLVEKRDKHNDYHREESSLAANWAWEPGAGTAAHLNGRAWTWTNPLHHRSEVSDLSGPLRHDTIEQDPDRKGFELGGDWSRPLFDGTAKLVGLARREQIETTEVYFSETPAGAPIGGLAQNTEAMAGETVGRATWSRDGVLGWSIETGGEVAFNSLDSDVDLSTIDAGGVHTPVPLPASDVLVQELRGEAFVSGGRRLAPTITVDWGVAVETSTLKVSGDTTAERSLTFVKPRASVEWRPDDAWRLRLAAGRTVAQLDFDDFVSGAEIANDRPDGGNANLEPERTWRLSGEVERRVLGDGKLRLTLNSDWVQMVQDRIRTPDGLDAPGNLGDGRRISLEAVAGLPLDRFRVKGGRFNLRWIWQDSNVTDPYTGRGRWFSSEYPWIVTADFRQDIRSKNLAWGVAYAAEGQMPQFRMNEIDMWNPDDNFFKAYVEARPDSRTTVTFTAGNLLDRALKRDRLFYFPDRSNPVPAAAENRWRRQGVTFVVQVKRTFG
jgi:hypothetical protein